MTTGFERLADVLRERAAKSRRRRLTPYQIDGVDLVDAAGRRLLNFGSNDYLGFAWERASTVRPAGGSGSAASALVCGWSPLHQTLADRLARFEGTESAVIFPSGYAACSGTVAALAGPDDLILSDALNHASLIDGCRLSRAQTIVYPHRDTDFVGRKLASMRVDFEQVWIVTDSIFSMDGDLAPLQALVDVAERFESHLLVDEAHATGVFGDQGSGLCEELGVKSKIPIRIGTLSKAMGSQGGFVAAPQVVTDYLINHARGLIYSTALTSGAVGDALDSLDRIEASDDRRRRVRRYARQVREELSIPAEDPVSAEVPIVPLILHDDERVARRSAELGGQGFFAPAIRPPTVPEGTARLRLSLSAAHTDSQIRSLIDALRMPGGVGFRPEIA